MALVAKNLGNTGSTSGNRVVWDFRVESDVMNLDLEFPAATLKANSAHQYGQAPGYTGVVTFSRIKSVINYGPDACTLNFTTATGESAEDVAQVTYDSELVILAGEESDLAAAQADLNAAEIALTAQATVEANAFTDLTAAQTELTFEHTRLDAANTTLLAEQNRLLTAQFLLDQARQAYQAALDAQNYDQTFESDSEDDVALATAVTDAFNIIETFESDVNAAQGVVFNAQGVVDSEENAVVTAEANVVTEQAEYDLERAELESDLDAVTSAEDARSTAQTEVDNQALRVREALDRLNEAIADHSSLVFGPGHHEFSDVGGLPLDAPITNQSGAMVLNSAVLQSGSGLVVEFRI